jgi:hypothetical protein
VVVVGFAFCGAVLATAAGGEEKLALKRRFPPGPYTLRMVEESKDVTTQGGASQESSSESLCLWNVTVTAPEAAGGKKMILRLAEASEKSDGKEVYSSQDPAKQSPELAFLYDALKGADIVVALDETDDTVVEASGLTKLWTDLAARATTDAQKAAVADHALWMTDKWLEMILRQSEAILPRGPVAVGEQWKAGLRADLPLIGEIKSRFECQLTKVEGPLALIEAQGTHQTDKPKTVTVGAQSGTLKSAKADDKIKTTVLVKESLVVAQETERTYEVHLVTKDDKGADVEVTLRGQSKIRVVFTPGQAAPTAPEPAPAQKALELAPKGK